MKKPKTLSGLFLAAAKKLNGKRVPYICTAIEACKTYPVDMRATAKEVIKERLGPHFYYTGWIRANHMPLYERSVVNGTVWKDALEGRIAWCHALAEEFKDK